MFPFSRSQETIFLFWNIPKFSSSYTSWICSLPSSLFLQLSLRIFTCSCRLSHAWVHLLTLITFFKNHKSRHFHYAIFSLLIFSPLRSIYYPQVALHRHTSVHVLPLITNEYNIKRRNKVQKPRLLVRDSCEFPYPADWLCISIFMYTNVLL
jgi:hypothetical protein